MKIKKHRLKIFCLTVIVLNVISLVLGVIYYGLSTTRLWWLWNVQGIIMLLSWMLNILLVYINGRVLVKSNEIGKKLNLLSYIYLVFTIVAMLLLFFYSFTVSLVKDSMITVQTFAIFVFTGMAVLGIALANFDIKYLKNRGVWKIE